MTTTLDKLDMINDSLNDIKTAVIAKGQTPTGDITTYATAISNIPQQAAVIDSLSITPTTSQQTITAPSGTDGYSPITVSAVTASIDNNIVASNIVSGVSILGVNGSATVLNGETQSVSITSTAGNTFTPSSGKNAITSITVTPTNEARTVNPSTSSQSLTVNSGYSGNGTITVNPVTSSIDANITAENIKKDVTILNVTGTYEGPGGGTKYGVNVNALLGDVDSNGKLLSPTGSFQLNFNGVVSSTDNYTLKYKFYNNHTLTSVSFPNLTKLTGYEAASYCFSRCTNLTSISFPNLTTVDGYSTMSHMFEYCPATSVSFPSLQTIGTDSSISYKSYTCSSLFQYSTNLTSVSFPNLTTASTERCFQYAFANGNNLTTVSFSKLATMGAYYVFDGAFRDSKKLTDIYFNKLTTSTFSSIKNQFSSMFNSDTASTSGTVNVHFPSNLSSTVSGLTGYPTFGGNSSRIVLKFDLSATS